MRLPSTTRRTLLARGFTLVELMMVVVILGILASVVALNVQNKAPEAMVSEAKTEVRVLYDAVGLYQMETGGYLPETLDELIDGPPGHDGHWQTLLQAREVPRDPWDNEYQYEVLDPDHGDYRIVCYGQDGTPGGTGFASDIAWVQGAEEE